MVAKNEADILPRTLDSLTWLDGLVVIDNGSTDGSLGIFRSHPLVSKLEVDPTEFDERYFVPKLVSLASEFNASWFIECDADEVFPAGFRAVIDNAPAEINVITANIRYMIGNKYYKERWGFGRAYRNSNLDFTSLKPLHWSKIPIPIPLRRNLHSGLFLKHYYIRSYEHAMRKYHNYLHLDPKNKARYDHLPYLAEMFRTGDFERLPMKECK
jgi:glycosyltransferase involved in cell wall biosynthesis